MRLSNFKKIIAGTVFTIFFLGVFAVHIPKAQAATCVGLPPAYRTTSPNANGSCPAGYKLGDVTTNASGVATGANYADGTKDGNSTELTCDSISTCIVVGAYYVGPGLAGWVAYMGAYFFSVTISISLNSTAYALQFLTDGWTTVRDLSNMAFIFILIYIAMTVMLQAETAGTIKTLSIVVVVALLVNFSFFFTRVVIDTGNILAVQFYNAIPPQNPTADQLVKGTQIKDLTLSLMGAIKPQSLLSGNLFDQATKKTGGAVTLYLAVYLSIAAMLWALFFVFIQVGVKFMMRIVGLWFVLVVSPLAFVSRALKQTEHHFKKWLHMLLQFSVYPAIFLFIFLILTKFANSMVVGNTTSGASGDFFSSIVGGLSSTSGDGGLTVMGAIAATAIRMGFIIAVLYVGLKVSDSVVKEGTGLLGTGNGLGGLLSGKALGVGGFVGRRTVGWAGQRTHQSATMRNIAAKGGFLGRSLWRGAGALGQASFDARKPLGALGVKAGKSVGEGGFAAHDEYKIARREKESKALKPSENQLFAAIGGVVKGLTAQQQQKLMNAAGTLAQTKEDRTNGDATSADVKAANAAYKAILSELGIKDKIKAAKEAVGAKNDKTYATAITTRDWRNLWGATGGIPGWIGKADKEAATKIRGSKTDADQIRNVLATLGLKVEEESGTTTTPTRAPLTRQAMEQTHARGDLNTQTNAILKAIEKNTARTASDTHEDQNKLLRKTIREMRKSGEKISEGFLKLDHAIKSDSHETTQTPEKNTEESSGGANDLNITK